MASRTIQDAENLFIRRWGEMAASWGVSRTLAEIHALLFLMSKPLCTDDVMDRLAVSRGSASTNLRALVNWGLIHRVHQRGDRKEYFEAETDAWSMFEIITRERRRREVQPIVETIERCLSIIDSSHGERSNAQELLAHAHRDRLEGILSFFQTFNELFQMLMEAGPDAVKLLADMRGKPAKQ